MAEDLLALEEKAKYERVWKELDEYGLGSPADYLTPVFLRLFQSQIIPGQRAIDFGCGSGRSSIFLLEAGLQVDLVDFADGCLDADVFLKTAEPRSSVRFFEACLWDLPDSLQLAEWGLCFDVLEHIPTEKIDQVLEQMSRKVTGSILVAIDLQQDRMGKQLGETLHLTVRPSSWWREKIEKWFSIAKVLLEDGEKFVVAIGKK